MLDVDTACKEYLGALDAMKETSTRYAPFIGEGRKPEPITGEAIEIMEKAQSDLDEKHAAYMDALRNHINRE